MTTYKDWFIPLQQDDITLTEALASLAAVGAGQEEVPLMVQLVENPRFKIPGLTLFHGAVDMHQHDCIHIVLGRGLLDMDEAFTIGFTMGTTNKVTTTEERLFALIAQHLYPKVYQFQTDNIEVFKNAVRLGYISACQALDNVDFEALKQHRLKDIRQILGLEPELLQAYYRIEHKRYPQSPASARLLT